MVPYNSDSIDSISFFKLTNPANNMNLESRRINLFKIKFIMQPKKFKVKII